MEVTPDEVEAGHAFYMRRALAVYDIAILGYFSRVAWKCPARRILQHYDEHVSMNHLDVGVGTGYFLQRLTSVRHASGQSRAPASGVFRPQPTGTFDLPAMMSRERVVRTPGSQSASPVPGKVTASRSTVGLDAR